jgi:hypothetical protein
MGCGAANSRRLKIPAPVGPCIAIEASFELHAVCGADERRIWLSSSALPFALCA